MAIKKEKSKYVQYLGKKVKITLNDGGAFVGTIQSWDDAENLVFQIQLNEELWKDIKIWRSSIKSIEIVDAKPKIVEIKETKGIFEKWQKK
jgi:small nuclear ribonucleoprotein (snRNP)-like protein